MPTKKTPKSVLYTHEEYAKVSDDLTYWKKRSVQCEDALDKASATIEYLNKTAGVRDEVVRTQQRHLTQLEKDLERESRRAAKALDVAEEASIAAGMIGRVTSKLHGTLEDMDARFRRADKEMDKKA